MKLSVALIPAVILAVGGACGQSEASRRAGDTVTVCDSAVSDTVSATGKALAHVPLDSIPEADAKSRYSSLSDEDFRIVARRLGVELAAMKAVVEIEAGKAMKGFYAPGVPVVNFDASMYRIYAKKAPVKTGNKNAKVPSGLSGYALKEWTLLTRYRRINAQGADMGTFWGMFQLGGFNYKVCGCESIDEFVRLMSYSELEQLELFATFVENTGMLADLKAKNWAAFARKFNGPSYKRKGYHTRMAAAYRKFKAAEK